MAWCHPGAAARWDREPGVILPAGLFSSHVTLGKSLRLLNTEMGITGPAPRVTVLPVRTREIMLQWHVTRAISRKCQGSLSSNLMPLYSSLTEIQLCRGWPAVRARVTLLYQEASWTKKCTHRLQMRLCIWWEKNPLRVRLRERPLPAEAHSEPGSGVSGATYHGCFKTFQALAQGPLPGLSRIHRSSAGQVCLVPH